MSILFPLVLLHMCGGRAAECSEGQEAEEGGKCMESFDADPLGKLNMPYLTYMQSAEEAKREKPGGAMGVKFKNFQPKDLNIYWDDGTYPGVYNGGIGSLASTSTNSYEGHSFRFITKDTQEEVAYITMKYGKNMYFVDPIPGSKQAKSRYYKNALEEQQKVEEYQAKNGFPWLAHNKRLGKPPKLHYWPADSIGQTHTVRVNGYMTCNPKTNPENNCLGEDFNVDLVVAAKSPRVLVIHNMLNDFERDHIIELGKSRIGRSKVGGSNEDNFASNTRTSQHGWLSRKSSPVMNNLFSRFSKVLNITERVLNRNSELLQVVRYEAGQQYTPHHDFFDTSDNTMRFITMLLYLQNPPEGGGTSFPKAYGGRGLEVKPPPGTAVLFYSGLPDGNADDFSLHSGLRVNSGTKWLCNLWVWDPKKSNDSRN